MFRKSLRQMVEGTRSPSVTNITAYISHCVDEIKKELQHTQDLVKATALSKLVYLKMLGVDIRWASFKIIEVMSMPQFRLRRVGFLAAEQVFTKDTDVVLLANNLLKKQLSGKDPYEVGLALSCLSNIVTPDLARDLLHDITRLMSTSKIPYVRQKATLVIYKLFLQYPEGLRLSFEELKQRLTEKNISVCGAAVNVICELSTKNPRNYLPITPILFDLLINASNNWMLIKVVKLLARLVQEEPRLARKILIPLKDLILKTNAKSVQYEALYAAAATIPFARKKNGQYSSSVRSVVDVVDTHLREFVEESDQNLKFLGLVGMEKLMNSHPHLIQEHSVIVLDCLGDIDVTIKMQALRLVDGMVTPDNLVDICNQLARHFTEAPAGPYRDALGNKIIQVCSRNRYAFVRDFGWYLSLLVNKICRVDSSSNEDMIASQLVSVVIRVPPVQPVAVKLLLPLIRAKTEQSTTQSIETANNNNGDASASMVCLDGVLRSAAWVVAEYVVDLRDDKQSQRVYNLLMHSKLGSLPAQTQTVFLSSALKLFLRMLPDDTDGEIGRTSPLSQSDFMSDLQRRTMTITEPLIATLTSTNEVRARAHILLAVIALSHKVLDPTTAKIVADESILIRPSTKVISNLTLEHTEEKTTQLQVQQTAEEPDLMSAALAATTTTPTVETDFLGLNTDTKIAISSTTNNNTDINVGDDLLGSLLDVSSGNPKENNDESTGYSDPSAATADEIALLKRLKTFAVIRAKPVSSKAQGRVNAPEGLRLKKWISKAAKKRAIAARRSILEQRAGTAAVGCFSLSQLSLRDNDMDQEPSTNKSKGADTGEASVNNANKTDNGESSDEFAQFRDTEDEDSSSSSDEQNKKPINDTQRKHSMFYLGLQKPKNESSDVQKEKYKKGVGNKKRTKKKKNKKKKKKKKNDDSSSSDDGEHSVSVKVTANAVLGSDDELDNNNSFNRNTVHHTRNISNELANIDLSAPNNDGLTFESLKQKHRTDPQTQSIQTQQKIVSTKKKEKKTKEKKKKDKKRKDKKKSKSSDDHTSTKNESVENAGVMDMIVDLGSSTIPVATGQQENVQHSTSHAGRSMSADIMAGLFGDETTDVTAKSSVPFQGEDKKQKRKKGKKKKSKKKKSSKD